MIKRRVGGGRAFDDLIEGRCRHWAVFWAVGGRGSPRAVVVRFACELFDLP